MNRLEIAEIDTPLGAVRCATNSGRVVALVFAEMWPALERALVRRLGAFESRARRADRDLRARLDGYFAGDLRALDAIEIELHGTAFQRRVWTALREIPAGATRSYGALAHAVGSASASRAVGAANGANPIWLIVPCHRAIGAGGRLVGYAGGIERKRWLLAHESKSLALAS